MHFVSKNEKINASLMSHWGNIIEELKEAKCLETFLQVLDNCVVALVNKYLTVCVNDCSDEFKYTVCNAKSLKLIISF